MMLASILSSITASTLSAQSQPKGSIWSNMMQTGSLIPKLGSSVVSSIDSYSDAQFNSIMANTEGKVSKFISELDERRFRSYVDQVVGTAVANAGASGFALESESTQQAIDAIVRAGEVDAAIIRMRGDIGQWEAKQAKDEAKRQQRRAIVSGVLNMSGSLLSTYSKAKTNAPNNT